MTGLVRVGAIHRAAYPINWKIGGYMSLIVKKEKGFDPVEIKSLTSLLMRYIYKS